MKVSGLVFVTVKSPNILQIFLCGMYSNGASVRINVTTKIKSVNGIPFIVTNGHDYTLPAGDMIGNKASLKRIRLRTR